MNDKRKARVRKFSKFMFLILFIIYITLYVSQLTGYYEYELHKKKILTEEQIKKFEEDVKAGNAVDIEDYTENSEGYVNFVSNIGYKTSNFLSKYTQKGIEGFFKIVSNLVEE